MVLSDAQMRAIELMLEQNERLGYVIHQAPGTPVDLVVRDFYQGENRGSKFEMDILLKIGALLAPDSTEPLTYSVII